jgi:hypothetical protein
MRLMWLILIPRARVVTANQSAFSVVHLSSSELMRPRPRVIAGRASVVEGSPARAAWRDAVAAATACVHASRAGASVRAICRAGVAWEWYSVCWDGSRPLAAQLRMAFGLLGWVAARFHPSKRNTVLKHGCRRRIPSQQTQYRSQTLCRRAG